MLAGLLESAGGDRDAARICRDPKQSWPSRFDALKGLLKDTAGDRPTITFNDVDALYTGRVSLKTKWNDVQFRTTRSTFLRAILEDAARGGWVLVRNAPSPAVTELLEDAGVRGEDQSEVADDEEPLLSLIGEELRPILRWLLESKITDKKTAAETIDAADDEEPSLDLVSMAYDSLKPSVRTTARRLSLLRPAQPLNGFVGPFARQEQAAERAVPTDHVEQLLKCGFLQVVPQTKTVRMPRTVRQLLSDRAHLGQPTPLRAEHAWLSDQVANGKVETELEAHHHAVMSCDPQKARQTAKYYGNDLRHVAYVLSMEGRQRPEAFGEAAETYRLIVEEFDAQDAYAWEYLGYNLARSPGDSADADILKAYETAVSLEPTNPLYRGRLVGFRARSGQDISKDFRRWMSHYGRTSGPIAAGFFGFPVVSQLRAAGRHEEANKITAEWPRLRED